MACFKPLRGWVAKAPGRNGGLRIVFNRSMSHGMEMSVPCGQCIGCRLQRGGSWAIRCVHEAQLYDENCFITLTYRPENMPADGSLDKTHFQKFIKRLRRRFAGRTIRYYMCGEYGERLSRPHYHACLFNFEFPDKRFFRDVNGYSLYTSKMLEEVWKLGFCTIGELNYETAAYCARYIVKKVTGDMAGPHYERVDLLTGEIYQLVSEYTTMSRGRRPDGGIGYRWYQKYGDEVFPEDEVVMNGRLVKPPRYYSDMFQHENPEEYEQLRLRRHEFFLEHQEDCTPERLKVREQVKLAQIRSLERKYEA